MAGSSKTSKARPASGSPAFRRERTVSVLDVAAYVLRERGPQPVWKLHRLLYYCQAWHLVREDEQLFHEPIEAWANGPVIPVVRELHRDVFELARVRDGRISRLTRSQRESIDAVLRFYARRRGVWLMELAKSERPWKEARFGLQPSEAGRRLITLGALYDYYGSL